MEIDGNTLIFIVIILFLFLSSPGGDGVSSQYEFNQLRSLKSQWSFEYDSFQNMTFNSNFQNVTGFKLSYQDVLSDSNINATFPLPSKDYDHWEQNQNYAVLPDEIINKVKENIWTDSDRSSDTNVFPSNIPGTLLGEIDLVSNDKFEQIPMPISKFFEPPTEFSDTTPPSGDTYMHNWPLYGEFHNVTFEVGEISIQITHKDTVSDRLSQSNGKLFNSQADKWKVLSLRIDFSDKNENEKHFMTTNAIYDVQRGRILLMTQSAKFHSLLAIPHYMGLQYQNEDEKMFNSLKKLVKEYWTASNFVESLTMTDLLELYDNAKFKCEYIGFLQLEPWNKYTPDQLKMIDDELNWPLGRPANLSSLPPLKLKSGILYSPDCGIELNLNNVKGKRYELQMRSIRNHLLLGIGLFAAQIYLLLCQMQHTNTPSRVNKISFYCFSMINLVDGSLATLYFIAASVLPQLYLPLVLSSFACFILASIFETRYLISVYSSQFNERNVSIFTLLRGNSNDSENNRATNATDNFITPDEASISGTIYGRLLFMLICFTLLTLSSTSWPRNIRMVFEYVLIFIFNSYWIPQIFRNVIKGTQGSRQRRSDGSVSQQRQDEMPLLWKFIIGTTIIRTLPVAYVFTYSSNVFRHHKDVKFVIILCLWLLFQISILYLQSILGARWFLPRMAIPEGYSYHRAMLSKELLEHGVSSNFTVDCSICMSEIAIYVDDVPETHDRDIQSFMVTPCGHIFHTHCLENWMSYKLQCPVCRSPLPPL
ncbi:hypothetical protein HG535_0A08270 [Zygotorulaspora mrakii]|uniref:RING-type E3 ubiquitin transferase n=1 Tax=Zygotorulaspora mrakii TaxID=42260 RepID=A0A7H9AX75_ZYGMR|nr:uncharacterized protein HG535_0A08270 [Zygotorulaspora mrakii]QLG70881.1 hypothetical protein HG535_0A08270 [Zygotorulaspora mrakii]